MKKIYLGLAISALLTGCVTTTTQAPRDNLILDPNLTQFRADNGSSKVWRKNDGRKVGLGEAGTSKSSSTDEKGSVRIRFLSKNDDFTAEPGITQLVRNVLPNTDYNYSLYYQDKRGNDSVPKLAYGVIDANGRSLADNVVHVSDVRYNPRGESDQSFRQTYISFNSGNNTQVTIYAKLQISDPSKIDMKGDIAKQTEIRLDQFKLKKVDAAAVPATK